MSPEPCEHKAVRTGAALRKYLLLLWRTTPCEPGLCDGPPHPPRDRQQEQAPPSST